MKMLLKPAELVCLNRDPKAPKDTVSQIFSNKISKSPTHLPHKYSHDMGLDNNEDKWKASERVNNDSIKYLV
jgi:hypothetical protein